MGSATTGPGALAPKISGNSCKMNGDIGILPPSFGHKALLYPVADSLYLISYLKTIRFSIDGSIQRP